MRLSDRRRLIDSSGIRRIFDLAATLKDPCNLSIGIPDFDVPPAVKEAAIGAIQAGRNRYTQTAGMPTLRRAILEHYERMGLGFDDVIVTSGTSAALLLLMLSTLNPGDDILVPDPYFVMYRALANYIGAKPVLIDTYPDFRLTRERLEAALTPQTQMLLINSPNNPTGHVYSAEEAKLAADFAREHNLILLSDEIYDAYCFDDEFVSPARYHRDTVVISGISKTVAATGWRLGWVCGPKDLIQAMLEIQQYTIVCAPSFAQEATFEALKFDMRPTVDLFRRRRDLIYSGLRERGFNVVRPGGAFYIFPEAPGGEGDEFVDRAIHRELLVVPGSVFSQRRSNFRISFASSEQNLMRGLGILGELNRS